MKIIARKDENTFFVEASGNELAQLIGWDSTWARERAQKRSFSVGSTIDVHAMYQRLYDQQSQKDELEKARKALLKAASTIEAAAPVFERIVHPKSEKN